MLSAAEVGVRAERLGAAAALEGAAADSDRRTDRLPDRQPSDSRAHRVAHLLLRTPSAVWGPDRFGPGLRPMLMCIWPYAR